MKIGNKCIRMLGGTVPMEVIVGNISENEFKVGTKAISWQQGWSFCRKTGAEIDHELGWGPDYGKTGSFIKDFKPF